MFVVYYNLVSRASLIRHSDLMLKTFQYSVHPFNHIKPNDGFLCGRNPDLVLSSGAKLNKAFISKNKKKQKKEELVFGSEQGT